MALVACDYSFARPSPAELKRCGYHGVMRYVYDPFNGKVITLAEAQSLWAAGLHLGLVWEGGAQEAQGGQAAGVRNAQLALSVASKIGWPADRPIYFVGEDPNVVPQSEWPAIEAYFRGVNQIMTVERTGAYGGQALLEHLESLGLARWFWQVGGWSSVVKPGWHLYQRLSTTVASPSVAGDIDEDAALQDDYGGWDGKSTAAPPPAAPAPTPIPAPVVGAAVTIEGSDLVSSVISGSVTLDSGGNGYVPNIKLPAGKSKNDIVSIRCDWASPADQNPPKNYPDQTIAEVDYQPVTAGEARIIFRNGRPGGFYTFRVFVA